MSTTNLYAHTEPNHQCPEYVSLNQEADGSFHLSVRERGGVHAACVGMTAEQLESLADAIYAHLYRE